jgi:alpha-ketoglutarate-dependent 2,4-dichlorophenoxyacetate dioxygenase
MLGISMSTALLSILAVLVVKPTRYEPILVLSYLLRIMKDSELTFVQGNSLFHTDSSFNPRRAGYSLLLAHELPPPGTGGSTGFADMRSAYRDLDKDLKKFLHEKNIIARHSILHSRKMAAPEWYKDIDPTDYFMSHHLLLQIHERSGFPTIYLAKHIHSLEGLSPEESQGILERLFEHATQDKYVIDAEWKDVGDMIVWDNTCTMHRAISGEFMTKYRRDMRRATVHDDSKLAWGFNPQSDERMGLP